MSTTLDESSVERHVDGQTDNESHESHESFLDAVPDMAYDRSFTWRALVAGLMIGVLVNISNTYYGLQTGTSDQQAMLSGLLGFIGFKLFSKYTSIPFTAAENVLIISASTATGCMPVTAGFTGVIPALEYVIGPEDNGPFDIGWANLILWSMGLCFFGLIFASLLREHFVIKENLPWPGPKATAYLIKTLHPKKPRPSSIHRESLDSIRGQQTDGEEQHMSINEQQPLFGKGLDLEWKDRLRLLLRGTIASSFITIFMYFVPILRDLPIFGNTAANKWLWTADLSPGFFGQGIITGVAIPLHMLFGAIVGWGILSPFAKYQGWAPGAVNDWDSGSRGWTIWVSLAALLADASVKLTWFFLRPVWRSPLTAKYIHEPWNILRKRGEASRGNSYQIVPSETDESSYTSRDMRASQGSLGGIDKKPCTKLSTSQIQGLSFLASIFVCTLVVHLVFPNIIPWHFTVLAVLLSLPMAVVGIRSLAETDYNPESALVSQLVFATIIARTNPNAIIINIISAGIAQAGASQAGDIAFDFKIGHLVGAHPTAQLYGQIMGSIFGAFISCGVYKLYAAQYPIPGPLFQVPSAFLDVSTARLVMGRGLPDGVAPFALGTAMLFVFITIVKMRYAHKRWPQFIPGGVSFAIGIYNMPSFTLARAMGGVFYWAYTRRYKDQGGNLIVLASGLVLGESITSLFNLLLKVYAKE